MRADSSLRATIAMGRQSRQRTWGSHIVYSDDHGNTWKLGAADTHAADDPLHPNECVAVELVDGRMYVNARDSIRAPTRRRGRSRTAATAARRSTRRSSPSRRSRRPSCRIRSFVLRPQTRATTRICLVYCGPGDPKERRDLTMLASRDEGKTWKQKTVIHTGPAAYCDLVKLERQRSRRAVRSGREAVRRDLVRDGRAERTSVEMT